MTALLRLEGAAALVAGLVGYFALSNSWIFLAATLLVPDLAMLGYAFGPKVGARAYNLAHTYLAPAALAAVAWAFDLPLLASACVWIAHIGLDRALGYGLKYESGFSDTHLGRIGRRMPN